MKNRSAITYTYKGYDIRENKKPIPTKAFDWDYVHRDHDGLPDGGDIRYGSAASLQDAIEQIKEIEESGL